MTVWLVILLLAVLWCLIADAFYDAGNPEASDGLRYVPMTPIDGAANLVRIADRNGLQTDIASRNPISTSISPVSGCCGMDMHRSPSN